MAQNNNYTNNPLIHSDRRLSQSDSEWVRSFSCEELCPLIVCRGPIRLEAMTVYEEMGISHYGILLSEKDSIVYPNALSPELRLLTDNSRVHRVPDYTGASKEERVERIGQIIQIAKDNGYDSIFAGYGFMAEDDEFVAAIEDAGLKFIGPCAATQRGAGKKDEAKRTALSVDVSVTPGIDNATSRTLISKHPSREALLAVAKAEGLNCDKKILADKKIELVDLGGHILMASYEKGIDLFSIDELGAQVEKECFDMFKNYPGARIRLKAIGGGGGKGQRILGIGDSARTAEMVREILNEVKTTGVGDNKNVLVELNIETTRHQEIQVIGNGKWSVTMGGRDCSLQMHEQKLLEVSVTVESLQAAIDEAYEAGYLGETIAGKDFRLDVTVHRGAGAYVCGEETSLLNSLEGKRGEVRAKPPLPALEGLFGKPTVVNNVLTLAAVPWILAHGGEAYAAYGMGRSKGTMPVQLAGNVKHGGLFEVAFGITLGELVNDIGGGTASGRPVRCVQVGGPLGAYIAPAQFDLPFDYEAFAAADALIGHAGITVFDDSVDMAQMARFAMEFCAIESCGKCTPCRLGSTRGVETIDQIIAGNNVDANLALLADLAETMKFGSLCAMGGFTPYPVMSAIKLFPEDFNR